MDNHRQAWFYAAATVALWSTVATAFELALRTLTPAQLLAGANVVAVGALALICAIRREFARAFTVPPRDQFRALGLGVLNPLAYYLVLFAAYDRLPGQVAQPLNYTWAITLSLLAIPVLGQRLVRGEIFTMLIAWCGVVVIATNGDLESFAANDVTGIALALGSTLIWAVYWLVATRDPRPPVMALMLNFTWALPLTLLVALRDGAPEIDATSIAATIWVGLAEMAISFVFWLLALQKAKSAAAISSLIFVSPFLSLVLLSTVAGETIRTATPIGLMLIVAGMIAQQRLRARSSA